MQMRKRKKQKQPAGLVGLNGSWLMDSRDSAGFAFGALLRKETATVVFGIDDPAGLNESMLSAWEQGISADGTVLATEYGVGIAQSTLAVTVVRLPAETDDEALTRLATTIPEWYMPSSGVLATPLSSIEITALVTTILDCADEAQWPQLGIDVSDETRGHLVIGERAFSAYDAMDSVGLDRNLHEWCARNLTGTSRWVRIFRPAEDMDPDGGIIGRHCGIFLVSVPTSDIEVLELVKKEVRMMLPPEQRLRLQPLWARQEAGVSASTGLGAFAWDAEPKAA